MMGEVALEQKRGREEKRRQVGWLGGRLVQWARCGSVTAPAIALLVH